MLENLKALFSDYIGLQSLHRITANMVIASSWAQLRERFQIRVSYLTNAMMVDLHGESSHLFLIVRMIDPLDAMNTSGGTRL